MDIEEEIVAFGETALWVECDECGRAFGGPGVNKVIVALGHFTVCVDCVKKIEGHRRAEYARNQVDEG